MKSKIEEPTKNSSCPVANCPVYKTLELFQGKWNIWVLFELSKNKTMRFGELKKAIPGISNTMLTATLKELERKNWLNVFNIMKFLLV